MATWLLKHFGSGPNNEAVLGDLGEQYQHTGDALRYWRQAIKAIPVSMVRDVRAYPHIAARALLIGWTAWILGAMAIFPLVFYETNFGFDFEPSHPFASAASFVWMPVLGRASFHGEGPWATPSAFSSAVGLPLFVATLCGWLVARLHREQQTSTVLLFAGSILLVNLLLIGPLILLVGSRVSYIFAGLLTACAAASILGILFGGGLFRGRSRTVSN